MESIRIALIGHRQRREFAEFTRWLESQKDLEVTDCGPTFADARRQTDSMLEADMTIVLQSRPDEFSADDVNALVGGTLFRRLLCCFGPWCESENRNRGLWPIANRVPVRIARRTVEWEMIRIRRGQEPIPPTCAGDEIFAYRLGEPEDWPKPPDEKQTNAVVIGPDEVMRKTTSQILKSLGYRSTHLPLQTLTGRTSVKAMASPSGQIHFVVHDLDPWSEQIRDSVQAARLMFSDAAVIGIATMPDGGFGVEAETDFAAVIPKLDLEDSLRFQLNLIMARSQAVGSAS